MLPRFSRLALLLLAALTGGACGLRETTVLDDWRAEAAAHGAMGRAATFHTEGDFDLVGAFSLEPLEAPFTVVGDNLVIRDVTLPDGRTGTLSFAGLSPRFSAGTLEATAATRLGGGRAVLDEATLPEGVPFSHLALPGPLSLSFTPDGAAAELVDITADEPLVLDAGHLLGAGAMTVFPELPLTAHADDVAGGGDARCTVTVGDDAFAGVSAVFARDAELSCEADGCDADARVTQIVVDGALLIDAAVEVAPLDPALEEAPFSDELELPMAPGEGRVVPFAWREKSYDGDAAIAELEARGDGAALLTVAATPPEGPATTIIGEMQADGRIDAGETLVLVIAGPAIVLADALTGFLDLFGGGSSAAEPVPMPSWVQAGEVGTFTVIAQVPADAKDGDRFATTLHVGGANFAAQDLSFTIVVKE